MATPVIVTESSKSKTSNVASFIPSQTSKPVSQKSLPEEPNTFKQPRCAIQIKYDDKGNVVSKSCSTCKQIKPSSKFSIQTGKLGNLRSQCKSCIYKIKETTSKIKT